MKDIVFYSLIFVSAGDSAICLRIRNDNLFFPITDPFDKQDFLIKFGETMRLRYLSFLLVFLFFSSCNPTVYTYTIIYSGEAPIGSICGTLEKILEEDHFNVDIQLIRGSGTAANLDSVALGKADFTIVENHIPFREGVKSVLVFYPQVLHIFYRQGQVPETFRELVEGKKVFMGPTGSGSYRLMMKLFDFFAVDTSRVSIDENALGDYDVFAGFSDLLSADSLSRYENFTIYSFDEVDRFGRGSVAEAISLRNPEVKPFILPANTYGKMSGKPVLTIASQTVLVAREGEGTIAVQDMARSIFKYKQTFAAISPLIHEGLNESFDRSHLTFPLHEGARQYLDRDEPGFLEKYAEPIGVSFSILIALISGLISLTKWQKQKKKDRVDVFYQSLMDIKNQIPSFTDGKVIIQKIREIQSTQNAAFELLIQEKLEANESFRIFMELSKDTINELRIKLGRLKA